MIRRSLPSASAIAVRAPTRLSPVSRVASISIGTSHCAAQVRELRRRRAPAGSRASPPPTAAAGAAVAACGFSTTSVVQVVQPFADEDGHDVRLQDRRIVRPAEHLDDVGAEGAAELHRVAARHDELGEVDRRPRFAPAPGPRCQAPAGSACAAGTDRSAPAPIPARARAPSPARRRRAPSACSSQSPQSSAPRVARTPAAAVVVQDDVVARKHHVVEKRRQRQELPAGRHAGRTRCRAAGTARPSRSGTGRASPRPRRAPPRASPGLSGSPCDARPVAARGDSGGGSVSRSSIAPYTCC